MTNPVWTGIGSPATWAIAIVTSLLLAPAISQGCGGNIQAGSGVIRSPNYPSRYPAFSYCTWTIESGVETKIRIRATDQDCSGDTLSIYDGLGADDANLLGQYCAAEAPAFLESSGQAMTVMFESAGDAAAHQRGFELSYESIDEALGSRVIWSEVNAETGEARLNSVPSDPTLMMTPQGTPLDSISTSFYYRVPAGNWTALDTNYGNHETVWSAGDLKTIIKGTMGTNRKAKAYFAWTSSGVLGIAVDWLTGNVYWTDVSYDWIMMYNADGSRGTVVIDEGLDIPTGIAVHPSSGYLFWTDSGSDPKVERSSLAGRNRIALATTNVVRPAGITIDYETGLVYWIDADPANNRIEMCDLEGENRRALVQTNTDREFFDLTIAGSFIYATARKDKKILIFLKEVGGDLMTLNLEYVPSNIMTYAPDVQPPSYSPCSSNPCSYLCVGGGPNGYTCMCGTGRLLTADGRTCEKEGTIDPPQYFIATQTKLCRYPINFPDITLPSTLTFNVSCFLGSRRHAVAIDVDLEDGMMFFSDVGVKGIGMATLRHGETVQLITGGTKSVEGLAVDWATKHLYWTDHLRGTIEVSKYDGSYRTTLIKDSVIRPRSIVIDPERKVMFWGEFGPPGQIERASLDGKDRIVVVTAPLGLPFFLPSGMAIDCDEQRLYYADIIMKTINSVDYNGGNKIQILQKFGAIYFDIALYKDYILWTELGGNNGIYAANRHSGEMVLAYHQRGEQVYGITTYADTRQRMVHNPCRFRNGGCDQLCVSSPSSQRGYICMCTLGFRLADNNKTCFSNLVQDDFFLVTDTYRRAIFQVSFTSTTFTPEALSLSDIQNPIAVSFDPVTRMVYWTDVAAGTLSRAALDGSQQSVIASYGVEHPDGIAVDPLSRLLYWTDTGTQTISVAHLDGSDRKVLVRGLSKPRAIVLHPTEGVMFWTDWGDNPAIERSSMDGTMRSVIVFGSLRWPNGLTIDYQAGRLYWCDAGTEKIETSDLHGAQRRVLIDFGHDVHTFDVAVVGGSVYWTDWVMQSLLRADKETGASNVTIGPTDYLRPNAMYAVTTSALPTGISSCSDNNGGCAGLCLPTTAGRTCMCPDGFELSSAGSCSPDPSTLCPMEFDKGSISKDCLPVPGRNCPVQCHAGFVSTVDAVRCEASGSWDMDINTICIAQECPPLNVPDHAMTRGPCYPPFTASKLCQHQCVPGYLQTGGDTRRVCDQRGEWIGQPIQCQEQDPTSQHLSSCGNDLGFYDRPVDRELAGGDSVGANCRVSDPELNIAWYKDGRRLRSGSVDGIFIDFNNQLIIPDFEQVHHGHYACVALSGQQECLRAEANITFDPLSYFLHAPQTVYVQEGSDHLFQCQPKVATDYVTWLRVDDQLEEGIIGNNLHLQDITEADEGSYTCLIRDEWGLVKGKAHASLFLLDPPQLNISSVCGTITYHRQQQGEQLPGQPTEQPQGESSYFMGFASDDDDNENQTPYIVGGSDSEYGTAPYMVRIWVRERQLFTCGAALLDQRWVITAAHCIRFRDEHDYQASDILLYLGDHDTLKNEPTQLIREAVEIIIHEDFNDQNFDSDIALIRMEPPLRSFNPYIRPICLPPGALATRLINQDTQGRVTGWGQMSFRGATPRFLKEVELPVVDWATCEDANIYNITQRMFCAGYATGKRDACRGDSGGPFAIRHTDGRWYQLGIVSWGVRCGESYGFYTNVAQFLHWIRSKNVTVTASPSVQEAFSGVNDSAGELAFARRSDSEVNVAEGSEVNLECIPNRVNAVVQWYAHGVAIGPDIPLTDGVRITPSGLTFHFPSVQTSYGGTYKCVVSLSDDEGEQTIEASFQLVVVPS